MCWVEVTFGRYCRDKKYLFANNSLITEKVESNLLSTRLNLMNVCREIQYFCRDVLVQPLA